MQLRRGLTLGPLRHALFLAAPLPAIAVGALVARDHGVTLAAFAPNLAGVAIGLVIHALLRRGQDGDGSPFDFYIYVFILLVAATRVAPGIDGVHRWLPLGPLQLNASAAFAPFVIRLASARRPGRRMWGLCAAYALQIVHVAQPDAAQSTAVTVGMVPLLAYADDLKLETKAVRLLPLFALTAFTWGLDDELEPVAHVEEILLLAASSGPVWIALAFLAFVALLTPFALTSIEPTPRSAALGKAYLFYWVGAFAATFFGAFPVPVLGAGAGPVIGMYVALTACTLRRLPKEYPQRAPSAT